MSRDTLDLDALEAALAEMPPAPWEDGGVAVWRADSDEIIAAISSSAIRCGIVALVNAAVDAEIDRKMEDCDE